MAASHKSAGTRQSFAQVPVFKKKSRLIISICLP